MEQTVIRKVLGGAATIALVAGLAACGDDRSAPTGDVVKGPVTGATVTDKDGKIISFAKADGTTAFVLTSPGPYKSTGGTYTDVNGVKGRKAPDLEAAADDKNITPMTTLYKNADAATKAKLEALCTAAGVTPDTIVVGTVTAKLEALANLNETIGELLTQIKENKQTVPATFLQNLAAEVAKFTKLDDANTDATLVAAITSVATSAGVTIDQTKLTSIANATDTGTIIPGGTTDTTGTTGGTSGGTSIK